MITYTLVKLIDFIKRNKDTVLNKCHYMVYLHLMLFIELLVMGCWNRNY